MKPFRIKKKTHRFALCGGGSKSCADGYLCKTDIKKTKRNGGSLYF